MYELQKYKRDVTGMGITEFSLPVDFPFQWIIPAVPWSSFNIRTRGRKSFSGNISSRSINVVMQFTDVITKSC